MRVLMLELAARDEIARRDQRRNYRFIGVALVALGVDNAATFEAGSFSGHEAI